MNQEEKEINLRTRIWATWYPHVGVVAKGVQVIEVAWYMMKTGCWFSDPVLIIIMVATHDQALRICHQMHLVLHFQH